MQRYILLLSVWAHIDVRREEFMECHESVHGYKFKKKKEKFVDWPLDGSSKSIYLFVTIFFFF